MNQESSMHELVAIEAVPAKLSANFEEVRAALETRLADYDVVVTEAGVKDAKALATEINKLAGDIDQRRKDVVAEVSEPVRTFDAQMKDLVSLCKEKRQALLDQVKQFEEQTREQARTLLQEQVTSLWLRDGVKEEFRRAQTEDLVKLSAVTGGGKLAKATRETIEERVRADKVLQDLVDRRLLELESRSYRSGLAAPLTRDHVYRFLEADEDTYEAELERLLAAEVSRQGEAERRMRAQVEKENEHRPAPEPEPEPQPEIEAPAGKAPVRVSCDFDITVAPHISDRDIENELKRVLTKAGITTLAGIRVFRGKKAAAA